MPKSPEHAAVCINNVHKIVKLHNPSTQGHTKISVVLITTKGAKATILNSCLFATNLSANAIK